MSLCKVSGTLFYKTRTLPPLKSNSHVPQLPGARPTSSSLISPRLAQSARLLSGLMSLSRVCPGFLCTPGHLSCSKLPRTSLHELVWGHPTGQFSLSICVSNPLALGPGHRHPPSCHLSERTPSSGFRMVPTAPKSPWSSVDGGFPGITRLQSGDVQSRRPAPSASPALDKASRYQVPVLRRNLILKNSSHGAVVD